MTHGSRCPYCRKKYHSSTWYRNHIETEHSGFVQSRSTLEQPICDEERSERIAQPAIDFDLVSNLLDEDFSAIEPYTGEDELDVDENEVDSDVESLNLSDTEGTTPEVGLPIPTKHTTAGRSLRDVVRHERSEDKMWLPFKNKTDFELARLFIETRVPKDHIDKYFKQELGPEDSTIKSAYRLFDTVDRLESGLGMKSWKEGFVSFSEAVSDCIRRTSHSNRKTGGSGWRRTRRNILEAAILFPRSDSVRKISTGSKMFC